MSEPTPTPQTDVACQNTEWVPRRKMAAVEIELIAERATHEQAEARLATMRGTVGFFASVIKCGERWSAQCDEAMQCMTDAPPPLLAEMALLRAEVEAHRGGKFDESWALQCEENWRLEKELAALKAELEQAAKQFGTCSVCGYVAWKNKDKTTEECQYCLLAQECKAWEESTRGTHNAMARAVMAEARLAEAMALLMILVSDGKALGQSDCNHANLCVRWQAAELFLNSTTPPPLLDELDWLRVLLEAMRTMFARIGARTNDAGVHNIIREALSQLNESK